MNWKQVEENSPPVLTAASLRDVQEGCSKTLLNGATCALHLGGAQQVTPFASRLQLLSIVERIVELLVLHEQTQWQSWCVILQWEGTLTAAGTPAKRNWLSWAFAT